MKTIKEKIYDWLVKFDPAEFADDTSSKERADYIANELSKIIESDK